MANLSHPHLTLLSTLYTAGNRNGDSSETAHVPYMCQPSVSPNGNEIAFCYAGDVWIVSAEGGQARRVTSHPSHDSHPIFSPDGSELAFASQRTGEGNIYVISLNSSEPPRRLTYHSASVPPACWSPDGNWIYFASMYDGICGAIYKISVDGGTPIRIAGDPMESHYNAAISPDGSMLVFNNNGHAWWRRGPNPAGHSDIWTVDVCGTEYGRLTQYLGKNLNPMWNADGDWVYYLSDRSGQENIWCMCLDGDGTAEQITHFTDGRVLRPSISADGEWIAFERGFQLWRLNLSNRECEPIDIAVHTDEKSNPLTHRTYTGDIVEFQLSPDGKKAAFIVHGDVFADLADKGEKVKKGGDSFKVTDMPARESQLRWHPESNRIVYVSDRLGNNQIFAYDFVAHVETQLTHSPEQKYAPKYSPDGRSLAYMQGNTEIWLMDTETLESRPFITNQVFVNVPIPADFGWSPDSKWLAFIAQDQNFFSNLYVQHVEDSTPKQITFLSNVRAYNTLWSPDGKFIIFNTGQYRTENQIARVDLKPIQPIFKEEDFDKLFKAEKDNANEEESPETGAKQSENGKASDKENHTDKAQIEPVEISFASIKHRLRFLTDAKLDAAALRIHPDNKTLIFRAVMNGHPNLWSMFLEDDKLGELPKQLTSTATRKGNVHVMPDGKRIYYNDGGRIHTLGLSEDGGKEGNTRAIETIAEVKIDFHRQKMQAFNEAWRLIRDSFYDSQFHGCDWEGLLGQFRPIIQSVQTQTDFREVLNLMVGELNASHLGARGSNTNISDSHLVADFDQEALEGRGHFKITHLLPESPLTLPTEPARVGEYLLAVDGVELNGQVNLAKLLQRKSGKRVRVKLNDKPELAGARDLTVQPIDAIRYADLRYKNWVRCNGAYVNEKSNGRHGYVHIRAMSYDAYLQFTADLDAETHNKAGVIIDVRFNPGGHIAPFILDVLYRKAYTSSSYRGRIATPDTHLAGSRILDKPLILIVNEHSASNAEMFSEGFRKLGLGKVVGMPTAGAVIWTTNLRLLDGTWFRLPRFKVTTLEGENTEGVGRPVDVEVDRPLGEAEQGVDSQLDAAVEQLLAQIDCGNEA